MSAKEMFEALGYTQTRDDDDYTIYEIPINDGRNTKVISFSQQLKSYWVEYENLPYSQTPSVTMEMFHAISTQIKEFRWEEEDE